MQLAVCLCVLLCCRLLGFKIDSLHSLGIQTGWLLSQPFRPSQRAFENLVWRRRDGELYFAEVAVQ